MCLTGIILVYCILRNRCCNRPPIPAMPSRYVICMLLSFWYSPVPCPRFFRSSTSSPIGSPFSSSRLNMLLEPTCFCCNLSFIFQFASILWPHLLRTVRDACRVRDLGSRFYIKRVILVARKATATGAVAVHLRPLTSQARLRLNSCYPPQIWSRLLSIHSALNAIDPGSLHGIKRAITVPRKPCHMNTVLACPHTPKPKGST